MTRSAVWGGLLLLAVTLGTSACAATRGEQARGEQKTASTATPSLYRRLGGREGIAGVVDAFVANALADPRIGPAFKSLPPARVGPLKTNIADFICENTGGPCSYGGRSMQEAHKGMKLAKEDVDACNAALAKALDDKGVGAAEKSEVMALVVGLMPQIVNQ
jgi:hemoglobin